MDLKKIIIFGLLCVIIIFAIYCGLSSEGHQDIAFSDMGTSFNKTTDWISNNMSLIQIVETGTIINNTSPDNLAYIAHSDEYWASGPFRIDFDVIDVVGTPFIQIVDENSNFQGNLSSTNGTHVKLLIDKNVRWWIGDVEQTSFNQSLGKSYIRFVVPPSNSITYQNFKISSV